MSWIKEEPHDEKDYKYNPTPINNKKLSQEDGHRNDHLDIIDKMKKEQGDGHGIVNPSEVQFS